jgi:hypothetical protein
MPTANIIRSDNFRLRLNLNARESKHVDQSLKPIISTDEYPTTQGGQIRRVGRCPRTTLSEAVTSV